MADLINIKGGRDGLRLQLDEDAEWSALLTALQSQLDNGGSFFSGARLVVDIGERQLDEAQLNQVLSLMQEHGLLPEALAASQRGSRNAARSAGLTARPSTRRAAPENHSEPEALLVRRTVRSGQIVRHQGDLTLIGDLNPGAELIAGGSVVVWGRLRGMVHAGAFGDRGALVCALELRPTQLRIANLIARSPDESGSHVPEMARIEEEQIVVEAWGRGSGR
jgi:septum site-determining protein MinC